MPARLAAALVLLALTAGALAYRRPPWRRLAGVLAALACIDVARLATAQRALTMAQPWWSVDVALFAAWSVAMGWGLVVAEHGVGRQPPRGVGPEREAIDGAAESARLASVVGLGGAPFARKSEAIEGGHPAVLIGGKRGSHGRIVAHHVRTVARVVGQVLTPQAAALCYPLALGIARPWLPRLAYLGALVAARLVVAWLWARAWRRLRAEPARAPAVAALVLAAGDVAALAAWLALPPAWEVAQGVTAASYAATGCVVVWAAVRR